MWLLIHRVFKIYSNRQYVKDEYMRKLHIVKWQYKHANKHLCMLRTNLVLSLLVFLWSFPFLSFHWRPCNSIYGEHQIALLMAQQCWENKWINIISLFQAVLVLHYDYTHFSANVSVGGLEERMMLSGMHTVADIFCCFCGQNVGWKYVRTLTLNRRLLPSVFWLLMLANHGYKCNF